MSQHRAVYVFQHSTFEAALEDWVKVQLAAYPQRAGRIHTTAAAMREFLQSPQVRNHNMVLDSSASPRSEPCLVREDEIAA